MAQGVVADNWSLQDISTLFNEGFEQEQAGELILSNERHSYIPVSSAVIQTEALFDFITDLVLRDEILVEDKFTSAWEKVNSPILKAKNLGVISAYPFSADSEQIADARARIVDHICTTPSLRLAHQKNVDEWNASRTTPDRLLSATLWGGAGMCARSYVHEKGYTPHPLRKRLFVNTGFMLPAADATHQLTTFLADKRVKVTKKIYGNDSLFSAYVNIPAVPLRVIQEADSAEKIISIALQMRDDFQVLRDWLKMFQNAMAADDSKSLLEFRKQLDSISDYIDKKIGLGEKSNPVTMEAGVGIFKFVTQFNPIETMQNQFGVRATLNRLIFGGTGQAAIRKYIRMFDEQGTAVGYEIESAFTQNN